MKPAVGLQVDVDIQILKKTKSNQKTEGNLN